MLGSRLLNVMKTESHDTMFDPDAIVSGLEEWVRTESPTCSVEGVNAMMDLASNAMRSIGATVVRLPGRDGFGDVVVARLPGETAGPGILVLNHLDTVHPVGTLDGPLPFHRDGDRLYGPGVLDMKGGAYIAWHALRHVRAIRGETPLPITFVFTPDEEVGSPSTRELIEAEAQQHRYVLVPEPAQDKGDLITGRWAIQRFIVRAHGHSAHAGATLGAGRSAVREIAQQIVRIEEMSDPERHVTLSVGLVSGGTFVNVVPSDCRAEVLAVTPNQADFDRVHGLMSSLAPFSDDVELEVASGPVRPLFEPSATGLDLYHHASALAQEIGFAPGHGTVGGGSDGNLTGALGVPTLDGLGLCGGGFHTNEEHILISSIAPRANLLARLFETLA